MAIHCYRHCHLGLIGGRFGCNFLGCMRLILRLPINGMSPHYPGHEPGRNMQRKELQNRYLTQRPTQAWHLDFSQRIRYFDT